MARVAISTSALDLLLLRGSEPEGLGRADQVSYQIETAILPGILTDMQLRETSTETLRDLGDLGAAISSMSARLAASRADPQNVEHLEDLAKRHRDSPDPRARRRMDSRFHVAVSIAAENAPRRRCMTWRP